MVDLGHILNWNTCYILTHLICLFLAYSKNQGKKRGIKTSRDLNFYWAWYERLRKLSEWSPIFQIHLPWCTKIRLLDLHGEDFFLFWKALNRFWILWKYYCETVLIKKQTAMTQDHSPTYSWRPEDIGCQIREPSRGNSCKGICPPWFKC